MTEDDFVMEYSQIYKNRCRPKSNFGNIIGHILAHKTAGLLDQGKQEHFKTFESGKRRTTGKEKEGEEG